MRVGLEEPTSGTDESRRELPGISELPSKVRSVPKTDPMALSGTSICRVSPGAIEKEAEAPFRLVLGSTTERAWTNRDPAGTPSIRNDPSAPVVAAPRTSPPNPSPQVDRTTFAPGMPLPSPGLRTVPPTLPKAPKATVPSTRKPSPTPRSEVRPERRPIFAATAMAPAVTLWNETVPVPSVVAVSFLRGPAVSSTTTWAPLIAAPPADGSSLTATVTDPTGITRSVSRAFGEAAVTLPYASAKRETPATWTSTFAWSLWTNGTRGKTK